MLINRQNLKSLEETINNFYQKEFNIQTQYKLLQVLKAVKEEQKILNDQIASLMEQFGERDSNGDLIFIDNGFKLIPEKAKECEKKYLELLEMKIQIPDIYFTLDELENLHLTLEQLSYFEPFIKL